MTENLINLTKHCESLHDGNLKEIGLQPKMCPAGIWTEGYGRAMRYKGEFLKGAENEALANKLATIHTVEQAIEALKEDLQDYENRVLSLKLNLKVYQLEALTDFAYNEGFANLQQSHLLQKVKAGAKPEIITAEFMKWNKAHVKGKLIVLPGLTFRRQSEALYFNTGIIKFFN